MMLSRTRCLAVSGLLLALSPHTAFAQDATAVADRLKAVLAQQNVNANWSGVEGDASRMVLKNVTVGMSNAPAANPIGDVTLENVTEENGGYDIGTVTLPAYSTSENGTAINVSNTVFSGLRVPGEGSSEPAAMFLMYDEAKIDSISVKQGDAEIFNLANLDFQMTPASGDQPLEFTGEAERFNVDLSSIPNPESKATLAALGYEKLSGTMNLEGTYETTSGRLAVSQYDFTVNDVGTLGLTMDLGGYTPAFVKSLQDMQRAAAAAPAGQDQSSQGIAMLGLMQQLTLSGLTIRFEDDSLTNRLLEFYAKRQNVSVADLKNQIKAIMPFATAQLNNPELNTEVVNAVNAFLDDPKSIEIAAEPAAPVPFAQLASGGMNDPAGLTRTLGLHMRANQDATPATEGSTAQ